MNPGAVTAGFTVATDPNMNGAVAELIGALTASGLLNVKGAIAVGVVDGREPKVKGASAVGNGRGVFNRVTLDSPKEI